LLHSIEQLNGVDATDGDTDADTVVEAETSSPAWESALTAQLRHATARPRARELSIRDELSAPGVHAFGMQVDETDASTPATVAASAALATAAPSREAALERRLLHLRRQRTALQERAACVAALAASLQSADARLRSLSRRAEHEERRAAAATSCVRDAVEACAQGAHVLGHVTPLHDLFCIGVDALVPHIGGFRLGRLPEVPVDWTEISEALGHAALLVDTVRRRLGLRRLETASVHAQGARSYLVRTAQDGKQQTLRLAREDGRMTDLLHGSALDDAVVCLAYCVRELCEHAAKLGHDVKGVFPIEGDMIGDYSLRHAWGKDGAWTHAMRCLLINLHCVTKCAVSRGAS
jgi:beclin 1